MPPIGTKIKTPGNQPRAHPPFVQLIITQKPRGSKHSRRKVSVIRGELKGYSSQQKPLEKFEDHYLQKSCAVPNRVFRPSFHPRCGTRKKKRWSSSRGVGKVVAASREKRHDSATLCPDLSWRKENPSTLLHHSFTLRPDGHSSVGTPKIAPRKKRASNGTRAAARVLQRLSKRVRVRGPRRLEDATPWKTSNEYGGS